MEEKIGKKIRKRREEKGRKREGRGKTTPKNIFSFFPGYPTSFCLSEQATNLSLCICMPISAQLLWIQAPYESALAQGLPKQCSALKLCLMLEVPHLSSKSCFPYSCLVSFLKFLHHFGQFYPTPFASLVTGSSGEWATQVLVQAEIKAVLGTAVFKFTAGFTRDKNRGCRTSK